MLLNAGAPGETTAETVYKASYKVRLYVVLHDSDLHHLPSFVRVLSFNLLLKPKEHQRTQSINFSTCPSWLSRAL